MNVLYQSEMSKVKVKSYECTGAVSIDSEYPPHLYSAIPYANAPLEITRTRLSLNARQDVRRYMQRNDNVFIDCR